MVRLQKLVLPGTLFALAALIIILWSCRYGVPDLDRKEEADLANLEHAVSINSLPSYRALNGINVSFIGEKKYPQPIAGRYAKSIIINNFRAAGEHAHKSAILITWENDSVEAIPAGATGLQLPPDKRAKDITIQGYSMHERRIFHDSARKGVLNWEILYEPVE